MTSNMENFPIDARYVTLGTEYGMWPICTEVLSGNQRVYSFGVGTDISWDRAVIEQFGCKVTAFDPTPVCLSWVSQQKLPDGFDFQPVGLSHKNGLLTLTEPRTKGFASFFVPSEGDNVSDLETIDVPVATLAELMARNGDSSLDILKMDIEGSEYKVVEWLSKTAVRPTQIMIEYHHGMYGYTQQDTHEANKLLYQMGYRRFYVSSSTREQGFVRLSTLMTSRNNSRGVVYFAFGDMAIEESNRSCKSLRESNPGLSCAVFTDQPERAEHDIVYEFNPQELHDIGYYFHETNRMPSLKVRFLLNSPFQRTAVLDADTYVKGDISEMFDILDDHDLALTNMPQIKQVVKEGQDRPVHDSLTAMTAKGAFSCAVFSYRKTPEMTEFLKAWWTQFVEKTAGDMRMTGNWGATTGGTNEQAILHEMIRDGSVRRCGVKMATLPNTLYNAGMTMWARLYEQKAWDDVRILHSHLIYQRISSVGLEGLPKLPELKKFR